MTPEHGVSSPETTGNTRKLRACAECARLKIRCRWQPGSAPGEAAECARCSRMGIRCRVPEIGPRKKRGKSNRVTELEKKIDGLVNLFKSQQQEAQGSTPPANDEFTAEQRQLRQMMPCLGVPVPPPGTTSFLKGARPEVVNNDGFPTPDSLPSSDSLQLVPGLSLTYEQADGYLEIYRTRMVPNFPFVPIDPKVTARELHSQKPFLFWCIIQALVPQDAATQLAVDDWVRQYVSLHIIVRKERKLEYIQGLLLYTTFYAWGDIHIHLGLHANGLLQMVYGLVLDINVYARAGTLSWMPKSMLADAWTVLTRGKPLEIPKQTLEEQRAILGGYFVSSCVAASMSRLPQIQYNSDIAKCFKGVRAARELPSDDALLAFVRLQQVIDRHRAVFPAHGPEDGEAFPAFREHYGAIMASFRKEVEKIAEEEPAITENHQLLWSQYFTMFVRIYEPAIGMRATSPSESASPTEPYSRTENLWSCLQAVQAGMKAILAAPPENYAYMPFLLVSNMAFVMMASNRLLLEDEDDDWDAAAARRKLDHPENARLIADRLEEADNVSIVVGQKRRLFEDNTSRWANYACRARWMRQWYLSKVTPAPVVEQPAAAADVLAEANMSWAADFAIDHQFWEQLMMDGLVPLDFGTQTLPGMMRTTDETMTMSSMIPQ
ncbi:fungal transcriptional regulatory protein [Colletotrichum plurivorum]|uniref:Fungal transcriptional regulatory protein n=1 Tax=Colletotrichum plurivorum TaxID=2175906 RepID=A0A8H6JUX4_9PEZI|nr:fungal transcriptional regulatory protein [Colletotrichum plurivorum]